MNATDEHSRSLRQKGGHTSDQFASAAQYWQNSPVANYRAKSKNFSPQFHIMNKVILNSTKKVQNLFDLLDLNFKFRDLDEEYNNLCTTEWEKELAIKAIKYETAAELRQKELDSIKRITGLLNQKGILKNDELNIKIIEYVPRRIQ